MKGIFLLEKKQNKIQNYFIAHQEYIKILDNITKNKIQIKSINGKITVAENPSKIIPRIYFVFV